MRDYGWNDRYSDNGFTTNGYREAQADLDAKREKEVTKAWENSIEQQCQEVFFPALMDESTEVFLRLFKNGEARVFLNGAMFEEKHFDYCAKKLGKEDFTKLFSEFVFSKQRTEFLGKKIITTFCFNLAHRDI